jgi:hypothetical protein
MSQPLLVKLMQILILAQGAGQEKASLSRTLGRIDQRR